MPYGYPGATLPAFAPSKQMTPSASSESNRQQPGQASKEEPAKQHQYYDGVYYGSQDEEDNEKQQPQSPMLERRQDDTDSLSSPLSSPISEQGKYDNTDGERFDKKGGDFGTNPNLVHAV